MKPTRAQGAHILHKEFLNFTVKLLRFYLIAIVGTPFKLEGLLVTIEYLYYRGSLLKECIMMCLPQDLAGRSRATLIMP